MRLKVYSLLNNSYARSVGHYCQMSVECSDQTL